VFDSLDPILVQQMEGGAKLLCGQFAFNANAVLTGDSDGCVAVYGLHGFEQHPDDQVTSFSTDAVTVWSCLMFPV